MTTQYLIDQLAEQLNHNDATRRYDAAQQLGKMNDARAVEPLITALPDENSKVQYAAFSGLVKHADNRAAEPIVAMLLVNPQNRLWELLKLSIGMRLRNGLLDMIRPGDDRIADALIAALNDETFDEQQQAYIIKLLGRTADYRVVEAFIEVLADPGSPEIRMAAADALGWIGDQRAVLPLLEMLAHEDAVLREVAVDSLGRMGDERAVLPLIEVLENDADEFVRRVAALSLGTLGDERAIEPLAALLNYHDEEVREAVFEALKRISSVY